MLAGGVLYWDFYLRDHEQYYNAYAKRWGVFEGVGRVMPTMSSIAAEHFGLFERDASDRLSAWTPLTAAATVQPAACRT